MAVDTLRFGLYRTIGFLSGVPRRPIRQLAQWYLLIGVLGAVLAMWVPIVRMAVASGPLSEALTGGPFDLPVGTSVGPSVGTLTGDLLMMIVMVGTLMLSIPVSWGYMAIREREGFDQSVVQTIVILPVVVAAIMMIVQHSLALAFALAGVSAAVRFRNTLKDVADATYVFLSLGIGIAAGVGSLAGAAVMSSVFVFVSVALWRCDFGRCPTTITFGTTSAGRPGLSTNGAESESSARNGVLSVQVSDSGQERTAIEGVLGYFTKKWKLDGMDPQDDGTALVRYQVRLRRSARPDTIVHEVLSRGGDSVRAAAFDVLPPTA